MVGTSVGALNGTLFAADPHIGGVEHMEQLWLSLRRRHVFPSGPFQWVLRALRKGDHLVDARPFQRLIQQELPVPTFEELEIPLVIVATNLDLGREMWFTSGPLILPIMASAAIPIVFPPVIIDGTRYVDGGVVNNSPVSVAVQMGAQRVWVIDVGLPCQSHEPRTLVDIGAYTLGVQGLQRLASDLALFGRRPNLELIHIALPCHLNVSLTDFEHVEPMIRDAYAITRDTLSGRGPRAAWFDRPIANPE